MEIGPWRKKCPSVALRQHKANTESFQWLKLAGTCSIEMKQ